MYSPMRVKTNEEASLYEHYNESIEINTLNTNDDMKKHLLSCDVLILEASFHDVWVECNGTLYITDRLAMSGDAFFREEWRFT